jgi:hypothetical protein
MNLILQKTIPVQSNDTHIQSGDVSSAEEGMSTGMGNMG